MFKNFFRKNNNAAVENIQIEPTTFCNLQCNFCWHTIDNTNKKASEMSFGLFKDIIDKMCDIYELKTLCLQGLGEPLMCRDIFKMIKYAKEEKNLNVWFTSNATLLNQEAVTSLVTLKTDKIRISLDTADDRINEQLRKNVRMQNITDALMRINAEKEKQQSTNPLLALNTVVSTINLNSLEGLIQLAASNQIDEITLIPLVVFNQEEEKYKVDFSDASFTDYYKDLKEKASKHNIDMNLGIAPGNKNLRFCNTGVFSGVAGNIHPCCNLETVHFDKNDKNLAKKLNSFRKKTKKLSCEKCFKKYGT